MPTTSVVRYLKIALGTYLAMWVPLLAFGTLRALSVIDLPLAAVLGFLAYVATWGAFSAFRYRDRPWIRPRRAPESSDIG